eukprot:TRINITY_DN122454_c0_g1_i1.p1 TRINITY_DN122454_c0_g1~~TRINITY_DN122454_c0_g1_i1.p1  ORF type:complete len:180 (+),score=58.85 TRINITY_DN122454_c0_g1_i1:84-623(+)
MADLLGFTEGGSPDSASQISPAAAAPMAAPADYADPFQGMPVQDASPATGSPAAGGQRAIPEVNALREWEDKHEAQLEETARQESKEKEARRQEAAAQLQKFYAEKAETTTKKKAANRTDEEATAKTKAAAPVGSNPWERVADLIDTNARPTSEDSRDTSRMRALLIQLKTNPVVSVAA